MRRWLLPLLVLLAGSVFMGCPRAAYLGYEIPDKDAPELVVESSVKGLAHVQHECIVMAATRDYLGESQAFMDPNAPEPQVIRTFLRKWRKNPQDKPWLQNIAPGALRFFFIFRGGHDFFAGERPTIEAPPRWDPLELQEREATAQQPAQPRPSPSPSPSPSPRRDPDTGGETVVENVLKPGPLSQDPRRPYQAKFSGHDNTARFSCTVSRNTGPQFVRLDGAGGPVQLKIKVTSHQSTGSATWWSLELVDKDGETLDEQVQQLGFIDPGATANEVAHWEVTGNARMIKINSGSEAGDSLEVSVIRVKR